MLGPFSPSCHPPFLNLYTEKFSVQRNKELATFIFKYGLSTFDLFNLLTLISVCIFYHITLHTRSLFYVLPSPFPVPRFSFFVLRSSFPVPGFSNFPNLVALIQWEFFWGLPLNSKWVGKITVFTRFPVITREATWKKNTEKTVYGHFTPWSFRPQSLRSNQK